MGWSWGRADNYYPSGEVNRKKECDLLISPSFEILKSQMVGSTYYAAIRPNDGYEVYCAVFLTSVQKKGYDNFGYSSMTEFDFPFSASCPDSILSLLTPTVDRNANKWREKCRENNAQKKNDENLLNTLKDLPLGSKIIWTSNIDLSEAKAGQHIVLTNHLVNGLKNPSWCSSRYRYPNKILKQGTVQIPHQIETVDFNGFTLVTGGKYKVKFSGELLKTQFQIEKIMFPASVHLVNGVSTLFPIVSGYWLTDDNNKSEKEFDLGDYKEEDLIFEEIIM